MKKYEQLYASLRESIVSGNRPGGSRLPTETELVQETGYSRQTVRQALSVLENEKLIVKRHGSGSYVAEEISERRSMRIAVVPRFFNNYFFPSLIEGIEEAASQNNYSVVLHATHNDVEQERNILCLILEDNVDGVLVEGCKTALPNPNLGIYRELIAKGMPVVFLNCYYKDFFREEHGDAIFVSIDDESASYEITSALIAEGHIKIGAIMKYDEIFGHQRCTGFMRAMSEHGIPISDANVVWFGNDALDDVKSVLIESNMLSNCTALLCYNDLIANQFFHIISGMQTSIRAVGSFDGTVCDVPSGIEFITRPNPTHLMGKVATEKLIRKINGHDEGSVLLPMR